RPLFRCARRICERNRTSIRAAHLNRVVISKAVRPYMQPAWFKLLIHNQQRKRRFGLTLAFLIGALRQPIGRLVSTEQEGIGELKRLLLLMRDETPPTHYICVNECDRLREPVVNPSINYAHPS